ncbi:MAG: hypothetical protein ACOH1J_08990 [Microbacteriaceae bacterium]
MTVPTTPVLDYEWHYLGLDASAPIGGVIPIPAPNTFSYTGDLPVFESSRKVTATSWGPIRNSGLNCGTAAATKACWLGELRLQLAPGWADYRAKMTALGVTQGRITLAHQCPADANGRISQTVMRNGSSAFVSSSIQIGCAWNQFYTIPSERVSWRFEWYFPASGTWVVAGKQQNAEEDFAGLYPDIDLDEYVAGAIASGVATTRICEPFLFVPSSPRLSSVSNEYMACTALLGSGKYTTRALFAAMGTLFGLVAIDVMVGPDRPLPGTTRIDKPTVRGSDPNRPTSVEVTLPPSGSSAIVRAILRANPALSANEALSIAMTCRQLIVAGRIGSIGTNRLAKHPCEVLPIYVPGADSGEASSHKLESIKAFPERVLLHNTNAETTTSRLVSEGFIAGPWEFWRWKVPHDSNAYLSVGGRACLPGSISFQCDEYPYNASLEAGPRGVPSDPSTWAGFTLSLIPEQDNQVDGNGFRAFKVDRRCGLTAATSGVAIEGVAFLVIPKPVGVLTTHICHDQP